MGSRSRSPKAVHQWISSHGCSQLNWAIESRMNINTFTSTIAMVAPIGCSVRVETNNPIAPNAENWAARYNELKISRHTPSASEVWRSEEHTSELQSRLHLVCRLLLEKKKHK